MKMARAISPVLLLLAVALAAFYAAPRLPGRVNTDILSLFPADRQDPVLADALRQAGREASNRVAFLIEGGSSKARSAAARRLEDMMAQTGIFAPVAEDTEVLWHWLFAHRATLLCPEDRARLLDGRGEEIAGEALRRWYAPLGGARSEFLRSDPFLLTARLVDCLAPGGQFALQRPDMTLVAGRITKSVYRLDVQDRVARRIAAWRALPESQGLILNRAGAVFHTTYGADRARAEMTRIGGVTAAAILLLYWLMFASLRAPLIAATMVICSLTAGTAATIVIFDQVHVMALVFGAALVGMVIDYTTYYLTTGFNSELRSVAERREQILRPLTIGTLTSVAAFGALLVFPVPAFRQIAVLGGVGLVTAWAATLTLTPVLERGRLRRGWGAGVIRRTVGRLLSRSASWRVVMACLITAAIIATFGYRDSHVLDNVREFQVPSQELAAEETQVRAALGFAPSGAFTLVRGLSAEAVIEREEAFVAALAKQVGAENLSFAASRVAPSRSRKEADASLIAGALIRPHLAAFLERLGAGDIDAYDGAPAIQAPPRLVTALRGATEGVHWSIVPLSTPMIDAALLREGPELQIVDPATRYSSLMADYRRYATVGLAIAIASTGLFLLLAYRQGQALKIMLPMTMAVILTPALTMALGMPFTVFSAMGLFLVVGAGVDYALFQYEYPQDKGTWTSVGIALAAIMTCISIGMLSLSSVLPVANFGVTVFTGISLSLILSPLARHWK